MSGPSVFSAPKEANIPGHQEVWNPGKGMLDQTSLVEHCFCSTNARPNCFSCKYQWILHARPMLDQTCSTKLVWSSKFGRALLNIPRMIWLAEAYVWWTSAIYWYYGWWREAEYRWQAWKSPWRVWNLPLDSAVMSSLCFIWYVLFLCNCRRLRCGKSCARLFTPKRSQSELGVQIAGSPCVVISWVESLVSRKYISSLFFIQSCCWPRTTRRLVVGKSLQGRQCRSCWSFWNQYVKDVQMFSCMRM